MIRWALHKEGKSGISNYGNTLKIFMWLCVFGQKKFSHPIHSYIKVRINLHSYDVCQVAIYEILLMLRTQQVINGFYRVKGTDGYLDKHCVPVRHGAIP